MTSVQCVFCQLPRERIVSENEHAILIEDGFPVSLGHSLVIPKRHMASFFEASAGELVAMLDLIDLARGALQERHQPDGFNIGINDGAAAGQTVPHLHIHLIPRYQGDQTDPRGGVRWVVPAKADYWSQR
jgi:diadenosine tetraphosphate (Ap4A) HIT family hydrolase